ncbi:MAG: poly(R)-hydroxyalkanoic acid synthase subunit PhaE [Saprospiraceae bacterium]
MSTKEKSKNLLNDFIETQVNVVDKIVENTKKIAKDLPIVNETLDKGYKAIKDGINTQKEWATKLNENMEKTQEKFNAGTDSTKEFFNSWFEKQMNWSKTMFNNNPMNSFTNNTNNDMMNAWTNWMTQMATKMNTPNFNNPWASMTNGNMMNNGFGFMNNSNDYSQKMSEGFNQWAGQMKQYSDMMTKSYEEWTSQLGNMTSSDTFKGMANMNEHVSKFFELWLPMFKSINEKTFSPNMVNELMNVEKYKEFMDSFFKFMPDEHQKMMNQMNQKFIDSMKSYSENPMAAFNNAWNASPNMMFSNNPYSNAMEMYSNLKTYMNEAVSPLTKIIGDSNYAKDAQSWNNLADMMAQFQIKNNELQYMVYQNGLTVMNKLSTKVSDKLKAGQSIDSVVVLYQDWLKLGDETFTELFNTDAYTALMTEVSSLQMKIKNEVDNKMEKTFFSNLPLATRSDLDEVYKCIYDMKKVLHGFERHFNSLNDENKPKDAKSSKK